MADSQKMLILLDNCDENVVLIKEILDSIKIIFIFLLIKTLFFI